MYAEEVLVDFLDYMFFSMICVKPIITRNKCNYQKSDMV